MTTTSTAARTRGRDESIGRAGTCLALYDMARRSTIDHDSRIVLVEKTGGRSGAIEDSLTVSRQSTVENLWVSVLDSRLRTLTNTSLCIRVNRSSPSPTESPPDSAKISAARPASALAEAGLDIKIVSRDVLPSGGSQVAVEAKADSGTWIFSCSPAARVAPATAPDAVRAQSS